MSFYDEMASTALELLEEFGLPVIIKREEGGVFDPVSGSDSLGTTVEYPAVAILADYSLKESGILNQLETLIQQGDKKITLAADGLNIVPGLSDRIIANGVEYTLHNIKEVNPAGIPLIYILQGRL